MKRSIVGRLLAACACCLTLLAGSARAQTPAVRYRVTTAPVSSTSVQVEGMNNRGMIVGSAPPFNSGSGFVYDSRGAMLGANSFHRITEFVPIPAGWSDARCTDINDRGIVVGLFERLGTSGYERQGFILDLTTGDVMSAPNPWNSTYTYARRVNNASVVLGYYQSTGGTDYAYLYDTATQQVAVVNDPNTNSPLAVNGITLELNNQNQILGQTSGNGGYFFRMTMPAGPLETVPLSYGRINDSGTIAGVLESSKARNVTFTAARYDSQLQIIGPAGTSYSWDLNNSGDVLLKNGSKHSIYRTDDGLIDLYSLVTRGSTQADLDFWNTAKSQAVIGAFRIAERDTALGTGNTGFGVIGGSATVSSGKAKNVAFETRLFVLTPEAP